jgi:hypothetical protein
MTPPPPRATIYLPPLDAANALAVISALNLIIDAIWDAHRDAIVELDTDLTAAIARDALPPPVPGEDDDLF